MFIASTPGGKKSISKIVSAYSLCLNFLVKEYTSKADHKMLVKLATGVNFINIL